MSGRAEAFAISVTQDYQAVLETPRSREMNLILEFLIKSLSILNLRIAGSIQYSDKYEVFKEGTFHHEAFWVGDMENPLVAFSQSYATSGLWISTVSQFGHTFLSKDRAVAVELATRCRGSLVSLTQKIIRDPFVRKVAMGSTDPKVIEALENEYRIDLWDALENNDIRLEDYPIK